MNKKQKIDPSSEFEKEVERRFLHFEKRLSKRDIRCFLRRELYLRKNIKEKKQK